MKRQYLYVYTCRRHVGFGRHFGYSGVTNAPTLRDGQHKARAPWYDLVTRRRVIPLGRVPRFVALGLEWVLIKVTMPVYNVQGNRWNPRRIKPNAARLQRAARNGARRNPLVFGYAARVATYRPTRLTFLPVIVLVTVALAIWSR